MKRVIRIGGIVGLTVWLLVGATEVAAATRKTSSTKKSTAPATAKASKSNSIARDPYLGAIVVEAATGKVLFDATKKKGFSGHIPGYPDEAMERMRGLIENAIKARRES